MCSGLIDRRLISPSCLTSTPVHSPEQQPVWQNAFGARLQLLRSRTGLTQEQLALASGLDRTYIGGVERGRRNPTLVTMWRIASTLGTTPAAFFDAPLKDDPDHIGHG